MPALLKKTAALVRAGFGLTIAVWVLSLGTAAADELRERRLESDVQRLQRELTALSRRIDQLERTGASQSRGWKTPAPAQPVNASPAWLVKANWDRIKPGMKIIEVIALLGRPTSTRADDAGQVQTLLYALELGPAAVLAGNVAFSRGGVSEVHPPQMR